LKFQLSPDVNENKIFIANFSELSDRYDPDMVLFRRKVHDFRYPVERMHKFFSTSPQYGANEKGIERETSEEPRYVRITDINEYGLLSKELGATAEVIEPQYLLEENDLLFARSGNTVGKSYIHKTEKVAYPCFFAGYLIRLRFDEKRVLPDYIFALTQLPYYKSWVRAIQRASGQPNINAQEYSNLDICIAPMSVQVQIVKRLDEAYAAKKKKDAQAKAQLAGIDALLLRELNITPAPTLSNTIQNRVFIRQFSEVVGERFDAHFCQPKFDDLHLALDKLEAQPLQLLSKNILSGITPKSGSDAYVEDKGIAFIRSGDFNADGTVNEDDLIYLAPAIHDGLMKRSQLEKNDVLFAIVGATIGKVGIFTGDYPANINQAVCAVRLKPAVRPRYLHAFFLSNLGQRQIEQIKRPVARANINLEEIGSLRVPIPSQKIQERIEEGVKALFELKRQLEKDAQSELESAKAEIEAMILGSA
jgi:type I restriction enzyme S subunit